MSKSSDDDSERKDKNTIKPNPEFLYSGHNIVKLWEIYLKSLDNNIQFYTQEGIVDTLFNNLSQIKEIAIVLNNDIPYRNKDGETITLCGEIDYQGNSARQNIENAITQIQSYNASSNTKIENHTIIFPYHAGPFHWNLGKIALKFDSQGIKIIQAEIRIYDPFGTLTFNQKQYIKQVMLSLSAFNGTDIEDQFEHSVRQQKDSTSCGAITAENGKEFLKGIDSTNFLQKEYLSEAIEIRAQHIKAIDNVTEIDQTKPFFIIQHENRTYEAQGDKPIKDESDIINNLILILADDSNDWIKPIIAEIAKKNTNNLDLFRQFLIQSNASGKISADLLNSIMKTDGSWHAGAIDLIEKLHHHDSIIKSSTNNTQEDKKFNGGKFDENVVIERLLRQKEELELEELLLQKTNIDELEKKLFSEFHANIFVNPPELKEEREKTLKQIRKSYQLALEYYRQNKLDKAEQEFVKVLRPALSKASMKNLYVSTEDIKEYLLGAMYHLGLIYQASDKYSDHHSKAAAIFQYCAEFSKKYQVSIKIKEAISNTSNDVLGEANYFLKQAYLVEKEFLKSIGTDVDNKTEEEYCSQYHARYTGYKEELDGNESESKEGIRTITKKHLKIIENITVNNIAERAKAVEDLYEECNNFFVNSENQGLVQRLIAECQEQLKQLSKIPAPTEDDYAIIGLGSLAIGTMTPWSDLEFAILVNDDKYKEYFRNLTKLLHIKIINLGETHLKGMGIESLNNFKTGEEKDEWFWDDVIKIKFNFDSARWNACKVPLGRQGSHKVKQKIKNDNGIEETIIIVKPDYELILTPEQMANFQKEKMEDSGESPVKKRKLEKNASAVSQSSVNWFESDKHLVQALRSVSLIDGSQKLLDEYRIKIYEAEDLKILQKRALQILLEDVNEFSLKLGDNEEGKLFDVKIGIYRLGDRVISGLANYYNITAKQGQPNLTVWQMITEMETEKTISHDGAKHLKEAVAIAVELRLRTYSNGDTREENLLTFIPATEHLSKEQQQKLLKETFYFQDTTILYHFYYIMLSVQKLVKSFCKNQQSTLTEILKSDQLFDISDHTKGLVYIRFLDYETGINYIEEGLRKFLSEQSEILKLPEKQIMEKKNELLLLNKNILKLSEELCSLYEKLGLDEEAYQLETKIIDHIRNSEMFFNNDDLNKVTGSNARKILDFTEHHYKLGGMCLNTQRYNEAIEIIDKVLNFYLNCEKMNTEVDCDLQCDFKFKITACYRTLGNVYRENEEYYKAKEKYKLALKYCHPENPNIFLIYMNLGTLYHFIGKYDKAIFYYKKGLNIINIPTYENVPNHPVIADIYNNLGLVCKETGNNDEAIRCFIIAAEIYKKNHNVNYSGKIAVIYVNLAVTYFMEGICCEEVLDFLFSAPIDSFSNKTRATIKNFLNMISVYVGNIALLEDDEDNAKALYEEVDEKYKCFHSSNFIELQEKVANMAYENNILPIAINCQLVLIKIDPELQYGNHYHDLACFYACQGNIDKAHSTFIQALNNPNSDITGDFHAEYAQFLIVNAEALNTDPKEITAHLYTAIKNKNDDSGLEYGKIERNSICNILKNIIEQKNSTIEVNSQILAYYLLIKHPEYIKEGDKVENLLREFGQICENFEDEISLILLEDVLKSNSIEDFTKLEFMDIKINQDSNSNEEINILKIPNFVNQEEINITGNTIFIDQNT